MGFTRLLLLPDGPWEQDEAIFAAAVLDYDIVHHRPQPPGFPGWIGLGKVAHALIGDPLLALRLLSCVASVATFVLLGVLLRRVVSPAVALAAATLHAFTPTVWFHAPRAFADTPAIAAALGGIAAWTSMRPGVVGVGWILLAWATLMRPQLLPVFSVIAILGARLLLCKGLFRVSHVVLALLFGVVVVTLMVVDTGGIARLLGSSADHFAVHERATRNWPSLENLGIVRGFGGVALTAAWSISCLVGFGVLARRSRFLGIGGVVVASAALVLLFVWHPATFPRYHVLSAAVLLPGVAVAAARVGPRIGAITLVVGAGVSAWITAPAMLGAHSHPLPLVAALREIKPLNVGALRLTRGSLPFARLARMEGRLPLELVLADDDDALDQVDRPFVDVTHAEFLPGATVVDSLYDRFPAASWDLSQRRFDSVRVVESAVLPEDGVYRIERDGEGESFAWVAPRATFWAQPGADFLVLLFVVPHELAPVRLEANLGDKLLMTRTLQPGLQLVRVPTRCETACRVALAFSGRTTGRNDGRELAARLYGAWCEGDAFPVPANAWSPGKRLHAAAHGVVLTGVYNPEIFGKGERPGAWTNGRLRAEFPAGPGTLAITLANPTPRDANVTLRTDAEERTVEVTSKMSTHEITVAGVNGRAFLEIDGDTRVPAEVDATKTDRRVLGQVLVEVRFTPRE